MTIKNITLFIVLSFFTFINCGTGSDSRQKYIGIIDSLQSINDSLIKKIEENRYKFHLQSKKQGETHNLTAYQIGAIFDGYISLGFDFQHSEKSKRGHSGKSGSDLSHDKEDYYDFMLVPAMVEMVKILKDNPDTVLITKFINVLISDPGSTSELQPYFLIEIAKQNPELLLRSLAAYKPWVLKDIYQIIVYKLCDENTEIEIFEEKFNRLKSRVGQAAESEFEYIDICDP